MRFKQKEIIFESRFKYFLFFLGSLTFVVLGIWVKFYWGSLFFGLGVFIFGNMLFNKTKYIFSETQEYEKYLEDLESSKKEDEGIFTYFEGGFEVKWHLLNKHKLKWEDIETIIGYEGSDMTLCLDIFLRNNYAFTITEDTRGYYVFIDKLEIEIKKINQRFEILNYFETMTVVFDKQNRSIEQIQEKYYHH